MTPERRWEIFRFCLVGAASFFIDYGLLYLGTTALGFYYLYASAFSFTVSVLVNYWLCAKYVFLQAKKQSRTQAVLFFAASIVGLGLNQLCLWLLVESCGLYYLLAKIIATGIVTVWNYVTKRWTLQRKGAK